MQVIPVLFGGILQTIKYSDQWNLSDPDDVYYRFDSYINGCNLLRSWARGGTLDENFLTIF